VLRVTDPSALPLQETIGDPLLRACGADPGLFCRLTYDWTESERTAEVVDALTRTPLRILVILLVAYVLYRIITRAIERFVQSMSGEQPASRRLKRRLRNSRIGDRLPGRVVDTGVISLRSAARAQTIGLVLRSIASVVIWAIAFTTILGELGINLGPIIASAGIVGVALGFGAQSLVKDFLSGIFMLIEDQYGVGDIVDVGEASGTIEAVTLRTTKLRDVNGIVWHVPNGQILRVGNMSQQWARALLDVSVAYDTDIETAQRVIKDVADGLWRDEDWVGQILEEPEVWGVEMFGPDSVDIRLVVKTLPSQQFKILRELRKRLKAAFDEHGIEIPFPQRTVWVRRDQGTSTDAESGDAASLDEIAAE
jgi:moderate conductance mechanosensitive channel